VTHRVAAAALAAACVLIAPPVAAQEPGGAITPDSIAVEGNRRMATASVVLASGLVAGRPLGYRDVQRAIQNLYATAQYADVAVERRTAGGRTVLVIRVREQPIVLRWTVRGTERVSERTVRDKVSVTEGRPLDQAAVERSRARIDSLYRAEGYHQAQVRTLTVWEADSLRVRVVFDVTEGRRVAIASVDVVGNERFPDKDVVGWMQSRPEGFWWFQSGALDDDRLREDLQDRVPRKYGERGYVDFQVLDDTVVVHETTGKAELRVRVSEGDVYRVGTFEIVGNRRFSTEDLEAHYPFRSGGLTGFLGLGSGDVVSGAIFDQEKWDKATQEVRTRYYNNGYIYAQVRGDVLRRAGPGGTSYVDLRWLIEEGQPAIVNRVEIRGNDITHERVIREAIVMVPGDVFRQDALIRSYQNISNLGFFNQPLPLPDTRPANEQGDVDVIFHVSERRTGNINFGASVGQGTGLGGFIGLDEPNLFGRAKRGRLQWQFGRNINDFDISYTDPAIRESRISGTLSLHNTRVRYRIGDLGRQRRRGGSLQFGFPLLGDRYTRLYLSYAIDEQSFTGSSTNPAFRLRFGCTSCVRSTIGASVVRDTRIDLPFATEGAYGSVNLSQTGGVMGGDGNFQKVEFEGRWYAPLGQLGGDATTAPVKFVLGFSSRSGFIFGETPFFEQLFFMGGTQFGIPLRGYNEFSITPRGFDPNAQGTAASGADAFGQSFLTVTGEVGARLSQMFYMYSFYDAGNLWSRASHFSPARLFRGAGVGLALISPLGPIGLDLAYGFDRVDELGHPDPGWKLHFRLGNFF
jgi:outer membrane protein insertion porin family